MFVFTDGLLNDFLLTYKMCVEVFESGNVLSQIIKSKTKPTPAQSIKPTAVKAGISAHLYYLVMIYRYISLIYCLEQTFFIFVFVCLSRKFFRPYYYYSGKISISLTVNITSTQPSCWLVGTC